MKFLLEVNDSIIRKAIKQFQAHINNNIKYLDHVCHYCSYFVNLAQLKYMSDNNLIVIGAFNTNILN